MKRYPAYKDSGVDWIGNIPEHWDFVRLKHLFKVKDGTHATPDYVNQSGSSYPLITSKDIKNGDIDFSSAKHISEEDHIEVNKRSDVRKNDIIMPMIGTVGNPVIVKTDRPFSIKNVALFKTSNNYINANFFYYLIGSDFVSKQFDLLARGGVQGFVSLEILRNITGFKIDSIEQKKITKYLDHKIHHIDTLIEKKQKQIEFLKEQRAAIINQAVTKGLDPNAKMKDSGIEWLGEIPVHWEIKPFKHCCHIAEGQVDPKDDIFRNAVLIAPNHIESGTGKLLLKETAEEQGAISGKYLVKNGDVVYSKIRPALNKVCMPAQDCLCSADMYPIGTQPHLVSKFLLYFMLSETFVTLMVNESMRVAMPKVNRDTLKNYRIPLPPRAEQITISKALDSQTEQIFCINQKLELSIELLKEYRTTLISEVVTGKIDIRDEVIP